MISIKRQWVQVPVWVLAGFESQPVGSSPNLCGFTLRRNSVLSLNYYFLLVFPLFLHSLMSLVSNCLSLLFRTQERPRRLKSFYTNTKWRAPRCFCTQEGPAASWAWLQFKRKIDVLGLGHIEKGFSTLERTKHGPVFQALREKFSFPFPVGLCDTTSPSTLRLFLCVFPAFLDCQIPEGRMPH